MEKQFNGMKINGFIMIPIQLLIVASWVTSLFLLPADLINTAVVTGMLLLIPLFIITMGYTMIEPNDIRVMVFFGVYKGTLRENGFFWVSPFYNKIKLTVRARNLDIDPIKVNDKTGNPVMIGSVLVWKVKDSYKAMFEIDSATKTVGPSAGSNIHTRMASFQEFVSIQCNSAVRNIASEYSYDNNENPMEVTLRSGGDKIAERLEEEINNRLSLAGIEVVEARINYLAYAPEIAAVMLRRQQASAIISAREKIVEGAVGMVRMALDKLKSEDIIDLDDDKKAAMVSNLLVVLCSDEHAQPVINTGTLNH